ncbi:MAG: hypothetical protein JNL36_06350 [Candidatus Kapabacteria bacterium]|nr:hypothetical protein [Candidatus Kapabacteria bacterium]
MKIFLFIVFFLTTNLLFSQNLSIKWENIIEGDTSVAKFVQPVRLFLDKNENGFIYLFNSLYIKSILKVNSAGNLDYHLHQYPFAPYKDETFKRSVSIKEKHVVFTPLPTVNAIRFSEILSTSNNDNTLVLMNSTDFVDTQDAPLVSKFPTNNLNDFMSSPKPFVPIDG